MLPPSVLSILLVYLVHNQCNFSHKSEMQLRERVSIKCVSEVARFGEPKWQARCTTSVCLWRGPECQGRAPNHELVSFKE